MEERRKIRSRSGCQTCRSRKVKCDERPGGCNNCIRLGLPCGPESPGVIRPSTAKRTYRSCARCRTAKIKCSGEKPCKICLQKGIPCVYEDESQPKWRQAVHRDEEVSIPSPEIRRDEVGELDWLKASDLPDSARIHILVNEYFVNVHPLRCYAFIHQPTFLQRLDNGLPRHALLHIICALGAHSDTRDPEIGRQWAKTAKRMILEDFDTVTIDNLMAAVLLHDYDLRMGNFANAFILSSLTTRMTQALQINLEYNTDILCSDPNPGLSVTVKESRRRLMWSCYVLDALVGSGVDQLTLIDDKHMKIQLPTHDRNFNQQIPCITEVLEPEQVLRFLPEEIKPDAPKENMGMMAYFIRHVAIRKRVLYYIKHLDEAMVPWDEGSEFTLLDRECRGWYASLPASMQFTGQAIYMRKTSSQLGALCVLHCSYYQTISDLYRLGAPALYKLRAAFDFPPEQKDFLRQLQETLFDAAKQQSIIVKEASRHGAKMLADSWLPTITYDSCRIMVYHLTQILSPAEQTKELMQDTLSHLQNNILALKQMKSLNAIAETLCSAAETMLARSGIESEIVRQNNINNIIPDDPYSSSPEDGSDGQRDRNASMSMSMPGTPPQSAPDYVLNPLSIYRMARKSVPERHAPEKVSTPVQRVSRQDKETSESVSEQTNLEELQTLFMSDLGWAWQPADTAVGSGIEGAGLLPWAGGIHNQGESWLPTFPFNNPYIQ